MNALSAIKWSSEVVSTGVVSLNLNDSLYNTSAENMVMMLLTLSQKSTNMQPTELYNPVGRQLNSFGPLVW